MTSNNQVGEQPKIWEPRPLSENLFARIRSMGQPRESIPEQELEVNP